MSTDTGRHRHNHGHVTGPATPATSRVRLLLAAALIPLGVLTLAGLVFLWPRHSPTPAVPNAVIAYVPGVIAGATTTSCGGNPVRATCLQLAVTITGGSDAGQVVAISVGAADPVAFQPGRRVRLGELTDPTSGKPTYFFDDIVRDQPLAWIAGAFALVVVLVARWRGAAALAGLALTYVVLVAFLLPALATGRSPLAVACAGAAAIMFAVSYLAHGISASTSTALVGTLVSLAVTGLSGALALKAAHLTHLSADTTPYLQGIDVGALMLCGLIIGTIGVLNDATVTQASAVWELHAANPTAPAVRLYRSALRIGRDHIASTIYTLALAYAGSALPVLLLFSLSGRSTHDVLTGDQIAGELIPSLAGGIGIALSVPLTTAIAAAVATRPPAPRRGRPG